MDLGLDTRIAFIDLEKAFDRIEWIKVMNILRTQDIDYRDRRIIYALYKDPETIVELGQEKGNSKIKQGVKQSGPLSPLFFNIFMETTILQILESEKGTF
jgi:retron-type reverse transcriptase